MRGTPRISARCMRHGACPGYLPMNRTLQPIRGGSIMRLREARIAFNLGVLSLLAGSSLEAHAQNRSGSPSPAGIIEPGAGAWRPWVLASGKELRLPPPPGAQATATELRELSTLVGRRDAVALERIQYWGAASPSYRWNEILTDMGVRDGIGTAVGIRAFA